MVLSHKLCLISLSRTLVFSPHHLSVVALSEVDLIIIEPQQVYSTLYVTSSIYCLIFFDGRILQNTWHFCSVTGLWFDFA